MTNTPPPPPAQVERDLLPCPFCGEQPIRFPSGINDKGLMIECVSDNCPVHPHVSYIPPIAAISAWNTRAALHPTDADRDRIARIIREYCQVGVQGEPFGGSLDTADLAADAILSLGGGR